MGSARITANGCAASASSSARHAWQLTKRIMNATEHVTGGGPNTGEQRVNYIDKLKEAGLVYLGMQHSKFPEGIELTFVDELPGVLSRSPTCTRSRGTSTWIRLATRSGRPS